MAKIILQELWLAGVDWDCEIPPQILSQWTYLREELWSYSFKIPRRECSNIEEFEIHGFSDASASAYAACLYVCSLYDEKILVRLLCSKTRVAPLKTISVPRLELCGALLLCRLLQKVQKCLIRAPSSIILWTDSKTTLNWIKKSPSTSGNYLSRMVETHSRLAQSS